jgi:hypothetical protein
MAWRSSYLGGLSSPDAGGTPSLSLVRHARLTGSLRARLLTFGAVAGTYVRCPDDLPPGSLAACSSVPRPG